MHRRCIVCNPSASDLHTLAEDGIDVCRHCHHDLPNSSDEDEAELRKQKEIQERAIAASFSFHRSKLIREMKGEPEPSKKVESFLCHCSSSDTDHHKKHRPSSASKHGGHRSILHSDSDNESSPSASFPFSSEKTPISQEKPRRRRGRGSDSSSSSSSVLDNSACVSTGPRRRSSPSPAPSSISSIRHLSYLLKSSSSSADSSSVSSSSSRPKSRSRSRSSGGPKNRSISSSSLKDHTEKLKQKERSASKSKERKEKTKSRSRSRSHQNEQNTNSIRKRSKSRSQASVSFSSNSPTSSFASSVSNRSSMRSGSSSGVRNLEQSFALMNPFSPHPQNLSLHSSILAPSSVPNSSPSIAPNSPIPTLPLFSSTQPESSDETEEKRRLKRKEEKKKRIGEIHGELKDIKELVRSVLEQVEEDKHKKKDKDKKKSHGEGRGEEEQKQRQVDAALSPLNNLLENASLEEREQRLKGLEVLLATEKRAHDSVHEQWNREREALEKEIQRARMDLKMSEMVRSEAVENMEKSAQESIRQKQELAKLQLEGKRRLLSALNASYHSSKPIFGSKEPYHTDFAALQHTDHLTPDLNALRDYLYGLRTSVNPKAKGSIPPPPLAVSSSSSVHEGPDQSRSSRMMRKSRLDPTGGSGHGVLSSPKERQSWEEVLAEHERTVQMQVKANDLERMQKEIMQLRQMVSQNSNNSASSRPPAYPATELALEVEKRRLEKEKQQQQQQQSSAASPSGLNAHLRTHAYFFQKELQQQQLQDAKALGAAASASPGGPGSLLFAGSSPASSVSASSGSFCYQSMMDKQYKQFERKLVIPPDAPYKAASATLARAASSSSPRSSSPRASSPSPRASAPPLPVPVKKPLQSSQPLEPVRHSMEEFLEHERRVLQEQSQKQQQQQQEEAPQAPLFTPFGDQLVRTLGHFCASQNHGLIHDFFIQIESSPGGEEAPRVGCFVSTADAEAQQDIFLGLLEVPSTGIPEVERRQPCAPSMPAKLDPRGLPPRSGEVGKAVRVWTLETKKALQMAQAGQL